MNAEQLIQGITMLVAARLAALCMDVYVDHRETRKWQFKHRVLRSGNLILAKLYYLPPSEFRLRWSERNLERLNKLL
jgi:hypothetical protein